MTKKTSLTLACATGLAFTAGAAPSASGNAEDEPDSVVLTGIIRDFNEKSEENGHPDFENRPESGFGHYVGNVGLQLNAEGKPVFTGNGRKLKRNYKDSSGNQICWALYDPDLGDSEGRLAVYDQGGINSSADIRVLVQRCARCEHVTNTGSRTGAPERWLLRLRQRRGPVVPGCRRILSDRKSTVWKFRCERHCTESELSLHIRASDRIHPTTKLAHRSSRFVEMTTSGCSSTTNSSSTWAGYTTPSLSRFHWTAWISRMERSTG